MLMNIADIKGSPVRAEWVKVSLANRAPVDEFDTEFETRLGLANEVALIYSERLIESSDRRNGRLAHPDSANLFGLDEDDFTVLVECGKTAPPRTSTQQIPPQQ